MVIIFRRAAELNGYSVIGDNNLNAKLSFFNYPL